MMRLQLRDLLLTLTVAMLMMACDTSRQESNRQLASALNAVSSGDYSNARRMFNLAIDLDSDNGPAHYYLGILRTQQFSDHFNGLESLTRAAELLPDEAEVHYQRGLALMSLGREDEAVAAWTVAVDRDPEHGRALHRLGEYAVSKGEIREAIDLFSRSIYAMPRFPYAYNALASVYVRYGRPREALQVLQNAIQNENSNDDRSRLVHAQNRADLGLVYMDLDDYDLAIMYLRQAVEMGGSSASTAQNLGIAYRERYRTSRSPTDRDDARTYLQRAAQQCNVQRERARCESIQAALTDLAQSDEEP